MPIHLKRTATLLQPDQSRVLLRPFNPGSPERAARIITRIMALPEDQVGQVLHAVCADFSQRHRDVGRIFLERFEQVRDLLAKDVEASAPRRLLIGSYFLAEYSLESAALFNPSIVPHPDQTELPPGALRFLLSLRATGEGHISSITFRTGIIHADQRIEVFAPGGFLTEPRQVPNPVYEKALFGRKLSELGLAGEFTRQVMSRLAGVLRPGRTSHRAPGRTVPPAGRNVAVRAECVAGNLDAGPLQLRSSVPVRTADFRAHTLSGHALAAQRHRRRTFRPIHAMMTAHWSTTRPSPPTMAGSWFRNWWRPRTSSSFDFAL